MCDDSWDDEDAQVACRQLGFLETGNVVAVYKCKIIMLSYMFMQELCPYSLALKMVLDRFGLMVFSVLVLRRHCLTVHLKIQLEDIAASTARMLV